MLTLLLTARRSDFTDDQELLEALRRFAARRAAPRCPRIHAMAEQSGSSEPAIQVRERKARSLFRVGIHWRAIGYRDDGSGEDILNGFGSFHTLSMIG